MEELKCKNCGSTDVVKGENGIFFCKTCGSTFKENTENSNSNKVAYLKDQLEELLSTENIYKVEQNGLFGNSEYVALKIADEILQYDFNYADAWLVKAKILSKTFFDANNPMQGITCEEMVTNYKSFTKYINNYIKNSNLDDNDKISKARTTYEQLLFKDLLKGLEPLHHFGKSYGLYGTQNKHKSNYNYKVYLSNTKIKQYISFLKYNDEDIKKIIGEIKNYMTDNFYYQFVDIIMQYFRDDTHIAENYDPMNNRLYIKKEDIKNTKETYDNILYDIIEYKKMILDFIEFLSIKGCQSKEFYKFLIYLDEVYIKIFYEDDDDYYSTEIDEEEKNSMLKEIEEYKKLL